jgi:hypothetical protein
MKRIKVGCSMGLVGCKIEDEIQIEDDEDVDQAVREWAFQNFEYWGEVINA